MKRLENTKSIIITINIVKVIIITTTITIITIVTKRKMGMIRKMMMR